jgi:hypothetical protein
MFAMYRSRAHRSHNVSKDGTLSGAAIFDTFGIFERDQRLIARTPYTAIWSVAGFDAAPNLSAFSAMVHIISGASHKLFLRLVIGDGAFPKSAKMRQKAPLRSGAIHGGWSSAKTERYHPGRVPS